MKNFTFVTLTFNNGEFIVEHLESIKRIINCFGSDVQVYYVLSDDASTDDTVKRAENWLRNNSGIFHDIVINKNNENDGTVQNYLKAISLVKTDNFKLLAGDDFYGLFDIFTLCENLGNTLFVTPITPYGTSSHLSRVKFEKDYLVLLYMYERNKVKELLRFNNFIPAPGVFYKLSLVQDQNLYLSMKRFKYIEDYPLFHYLLFEKKINLIVGKQSYVYYRIGSGISTNPNSSFKLEYQNDVKKLRETFRLSAFLLPKLINPYRYYLKFIAIKAINNKSTSKINYLYNFKDCDNHK